MSSDDADKSGRIVVEGVSDIIDILQQDKNADHSFQILTSAISFVICNWIMTEKEAQEALHTSFYVVSETIKKAEELGATNWTRGTHH